MKTNNTSNNKEASDYNEAIDQEKQEIDILKDKNLLIKIIEDAENEGIVGEENTILCLVNKICLRLVKNAIPTSSNVIVSDSSGLKTKLEVIKNIRCQAPIYPLRKDRTAVASVDNCS
jgi:hypothetical protein